MSYTTNFDAATIRGTMERSQVVAGTNLFLYDRVLGFTWQITKESFVPWHEIIPLLLSKI